MMSAEQDESIAVALVADVRRGGPAPPEAAPLAQPSRQRIAQALAAHPEGMTAYDLARAIGRHHNVVREHLAVLARTGLVSSARDVSSGRRGRPSIRYRLEATDSVTASGHRELVRLLMTLVRRAAMGPDEVEQVGREEGRLLGEPHGGADEVVEVFAHLGFAPEEVTSGAGRRRGQMELRLRHCPFREAVLAPGGEVVCALHRGLSVGLLERVAEDAALVGFEPRDPRQAGCRVSLRGLSPR